VLQPERVAHLVGDGPGHPVDEVVQAGRPVQDVPAEHEGDLVAPVPVVHRGHPERGGELRPGHGAVAPVDEDKDVTLVRVRQLALVGVLVAEEDLQVVRVVVLHDLDVNPGGDEVGVGPVDDPVLVGVEEGRGPGREQAAEAGDGLGRQVPPALGELGGRDEVAVEVEDSLLDDADRGRHLAGLEGLGLQGGLLVAAGHDSLLAWGWGSGFRLPPPPRPPGRGCDKRGLIFPGRLPPEPHDFGYEPGARTGCPPAGKVGGPSLWGAGGQLAYRKS
jgi:hypothetical protein